MFVALSLCVIVGILFLIVTRVRRTQKYNEPPYCSRSLPIIGVTHLMLGDTCSLWLAMKSFAQDTVKLGGVAKIRFGLETFYVITDPEDALTVANSCLAKLYFYNFVKSWFGQSLLAAPVPIWKRDRKLLSPAFSIPVVYGFIDIFNYHAKQMVDEMGSLARQGPFIATAAIQKNVLRTSCSTAFGNSKFEDEELFGEYLTAIKELCQMFVQRFQKFWLQNDIIYKLSGKKAKEVNLVKKLIAVSDEIVKEAADAAENQKHDNIKKYKNGARSFLDMYLQLNENNILNRIELRQQLDLTIGAAFDTTAMQLEIILIYIGSYAEIQERMFEEINREIDREKDIDKISLQRLVYTEAVIKEIVRVTPVTPLIGRCADRDVKLKNYTLAAGSQIIISAYGINHDPLWGPDVDQFNPDRWLTQGTSIPNALATFSLGKRACIGKTYALTFLKVSVAHLLLRYRIKADETKVQYKIEVLLSPAKGNDISLEPRN